MGSTIGWSFEQGWATSLGGGHYGMLLIHNLLHSTTYCEKKFSFINVAFLEIPKPLTLSALVLMGQEAPFFLFFLLKFWSWTYVWHWQLSGFGASWGCARQRRGRDCHLVTFGMVREASTKQGWGCLSGFFLTTQLQSFMFSE